jgi:hypothetical protein
MMYHWVVCYDEDTDGFEIDWDLTYHALDGVVYNPAEAFGGYAWTNVEDDQEELYENLSTNLSHALDKLDGK